MTSIIILVHNNVEYIKECLSSIYEHTRMVRTPFEIIVVSNGTTEEACIEYLKDQEKQGRTRLIISEENLGFPGGNNLGAQMISPQSKYVCLLNSDTIVTVNWLEKLHDAMGNDPWTGLVGPYTNECAGQQKISMQPFASMNDLQFYAEQFRGAIIGTKFLSFFCVMIRRELWDKVGGLCEEYGRGNYEDNDFCFHAKKRGYQIKIANCFIFHHGGATFGYKRTDKELWDFQVLLARNQKIFLKRSGMYHSISLCMIIADHEDPKVIERCIRSCALWVDEVNAIINFKKKRNHKKEYLINKALSCIPGVEVYSKYLKWSDFSDMRNRSIMMSTFDYIFWMDCDDILLAPQLLRDTPAYNPDAEYFRVNLRSYKPNGSIDYIMQTRLFKNKKEYRFRNKVHEDVFLSMKEQKAKGLTSQIIIHHLGYTDPKIYQQKNDRNMKVLLEEIKKPEAHTLTYYALVNCYLVKTWSAKLYIPMMERTIQLIDECFKRFSMKEDDPLLPAMWILRGQACLSIGSFRAREAALSDFRTAFNRWKHPEAAVLLSRLLLENKSYQEVVDVLNVIYQVKEFKMTNIPFNIQEVEYEMLQNLGCAWLGLAELEIRKTALSQTSKINELLKNAEKAFIDLLKIDNKSLIALSRLADIFRKRNDYNAAAFAEVKAVNFHPDYFEGWKNLGVFELQTGRPHTARVFFREALRIRPDDQMTKHNYDQIVNAYGPKLKSIFNRLRRLIIK